MVTKPPRKMPRQKPGRTPWELIDAVETIWGPITFDLAATAKNCKVRGKQTHRRYGPGSTFGEDALTKDWTKLKGNLWLNPEFGHIEPWAKKSSESVFPNRPTIIFLLIPASVGSNWWSSWVHEKAAVKFLSPRVTFVGHTQCYPKDLALCVFGDPPGYECWRWK